jgi:hypothetical protein
MSAEAIKEIEGLLEAELQSVREQNMRSLMMGVAMALLVGVYLAWAASQVNKVLDPEGIALAATGVAIDAVPEAAKNLRGLVVDGAPDLAKAASQSIVEMIPTYRQVMEDELAPIVDEVTSILANTAVDAMVEAAKTGTIDESMAMEDAAAAVMIRMDGLFVEGLNESMEDDGPSPQDAIDAALMQLKTIDRGLSRHARNQGDSQERELLLAWIGLLGQVESEAQRAATETYAVGEDVKD